MLKSKALEHAKLFFALENLLLAYGCRGLINVCSAPEVEIQS